jgi:hypothetical protein
MLASVRDSRENSMTMTTDEHRALFQEIDLSLQHEMPTDNITIGLSVTDLVGVATLANRTQRNDLLHVIRDVAIEQQEAASPASVDKRLYQAVGNVVGSLLYANRDIPFSEAPALSTRDMKIFRIYRIQD